MSGCTPVARLGYPNVLLLRHGQVVVALPKDRAGNNDEQGNSKHESAIHGPHPLGGNGGLLGTGPLSDEMGGSFAVHSAPTPSAFV